MKLESAALEGAEEEEVLEAVIQTRTQRLIRVMSRAMAQEVQVLQFLLWHRRRISMTPRCTTQVEG